MPFWGHVSAEVSSSDQVFNLLFYLDAVICSVSMVLVELIVFGVVPSRGV